MTRYEKAMKLKVKDFKQIIGVKPRTFDEMAKILTEAYNEKHKKGGRPSKLSIFDQLFMSMKYWRQYVTQKELAYEFEVGEATVHDTIAWVENTLIKSGTFKLPGKKALLEENENENEIEVIIIDVTESPIERPKKNKKTGIPERKRDTL